MTAKPIQNQLKDAYKKLELCHTQVEEAGTYFDPKVVLAFLKAKPEIKKILSASLTIEDFIKKR